MEVGSSCTEILCWAKLLRADYVIEQRLNGALKACKEKEDLRV